MNKMMAEVEVGNARENPEVNRNVGHGNAAYAEVGKKDAGKANGCAQIKPRRNFGVLFLIALGLFGLFVAFLHSCKTTIEGGNARVEAKINAPVVVRNAATSEDMSKQAAAREREAAREEAARMEAAKREAAKREAARKREEVRLHKEIQRFRADVESRTRQFLVALDRSHDEFMGGYPFGEATKAMDDARSGARFLASKEGICGFKACARMAYQIAYDKIKKTNTFETSLSGVLNEHVVNHLARASEVYRDKTAQHLEAVNRSAQAYSEGISGRYDEFAALTKSFKLIGGDVLADAVRAQEDFKGKVQERAVRAVEVSVSAALELAFAKSTIATLRNVGKRVIASLLAKVVARQTASLATGTGCALVDGPSPVGDVIGAGIAVCGTAWTTYDLWVVAKKMPKAMEDDLMKSIDLIDAELRKSSKAKVSSVHKSLKSKLTEELERFGGGK